jgi:cytochrome c553
MRPRVIVRWAGRLAAAALGVALLAAAGTYGASEYRLRTSYAVRPHALRAPEAPAAARVALGRHVAAARGCVDCHGADLGGRVFIDAPPVGRIVAPNLTRGRSGHALTDADWERAVRHGVRRDGSPLLIMPSAEYAGLSDEDVAAVMAYARSLPARRAVLPPTKVGPVARALVATEQVHLAAAVVNHAAPHPTRVVPAPTAEYGRYVTATCTGCHGERFGGGPIPGTPPDFKPASNLTPAGIGHYTEADFIRALRTGVRPGGAPIDTAMPWKVLRELSDVELRAAYAYLRTLPARPYGSR